MILMQAYTHFTNQFRHVESELTQLKPLTCFLIKYSNITLSECFWLLWLNCGVNSLVRQILSFWLTMQISLLKKNNLLQRKIHIFCSCCKFVVLK